MDFRLFVASYLGEPVKRGRKWWSWHCQVNRPDSKPSLMVEADGFKCFSCGAYGGGRSARAAFLHYELGWSWAMAYQEVRDDRRDYHPRQEQEYRVGLVPPSEEWRQTFWELWRASLRSLEMSRRGRQYLGDRGLGLRTCAYFGVGYNSSWVYVPQWDTWLAEGIVFPAFVGNTLWSLEVRVTSETGPKYHRPKGGTEPTPFGIGLMRDKDTLVICEGAFDAMAAWQVCGGEVDVVGLRGAANQLGWWEHYLTTHPCKVLVLDADDAGDDCAERLLHRHPTWRHRRPPDGMDLGDMLLAGILTKEWLLEV